MKSKLRRSCSSRRLLLETLERRLNLATIVWDGGGDQSSWEDPLNWQGDRLPIAADQVVIDLPAAPNVVIRSDVHVDSLVTNGLLSVQPKSFGIPTILTIAKTLDASNGVRLFDSHLVNATTSAATHVGLFGATLKNVTIDGTAAANNQRLTIKGGLDLHGTLDVFSQLYVAESLTIQGDGQLVLGAETVPGNLTIDPAAVLTIESQLNVAGKYAQINGGSLVNHATITARNLQLSTKTFQNYGTILVQQGGAATINVMDWAGPHGTLIADNAVLELTGTYRSPSQVTLINNGMVFFAGTIDNQNRELRFAGQGTATLRGRLVGGSVPIGVELEAGSLSGLENVVVNGKVVAHVSLLSLAGTVTINGSLEFRSGAINVPHSVSLAGSGTVELSSQLSQSRISVAADAVLTLGSDLTVKSSSAEIVGGKLVNYGMIDSSGLTLRTAALENFGTIRSSNGSTTIIGQSWSGPYGTLIADGGWLELDGSYQTPDSLTLANDGTIRFRGTIDNHGRQVQVSGQGSTFLDGRLVGGTVPVGLTLQAGQAAKLDDVVVDGRILSNERPVAIIHGLTLNGAIDMLAAAIDIPESVAIVGSGTIDLGYGGTAVRSEVRLSEGATLTFASGLKVTGNYGKFRAGKLINYGLVDGSNIVFWNDQLENHGTIRARQGIVSIDVSDWAGPYGTLLADEGRLEISGTYKTPDMVTLVNNGSVSFYGVIDNRERQVRVSGEGLAVLAGKLVGGTVPVGINLRSRNGALENVIIDGSVLVESSGLTINKGLTLNGTLEARSGYIAIPESLTITGAGNIWLNPHGAVSIDSAAALTLDSGITLTSNFGRVDSGTLINRGLIVATEQLVIASSITRNFGTLRSLGGIQLENVWQNFGTFETLSRTLEGGTRFGSIASNSQSLNFDDGNLSGGTWRLEAGTTMNLFASPVLANRATIHLYPNATFTTATGQPSLSRLTLNDVGGTLALYPGTRFELAGDFSNLGTLSFPVAAESGRLVVAGQATLDGVISAASLDSFVAQRDHRFSILEYASAAGSFREIQSRFFTYEVDARRAWLISKRAGADLAATGLSIENSAWTVDQSVSVTYTVANRSPQSFNESWSDGIFLSADRTLDAGDLLIGASTYAGLLAVEGSYQSTWSGKLPAALPGVYFVLVAADFRARLSDPVRSNNVIASATSVDVSMLTMEAGERRALSLAPYATLHLRLNSQQLDDFRLKIERQSGAGELELLTRKLFLPQPYIFDDRLVTSAGGALAFSPTGEDSIHYVMLRSRSGETLNVELSSAYVGLEVNSFSPSSAANVGRVTLEIRGHGFETSTQVTLVHGDRNMAAVSKSNIDANLMWATFDLTGQPVGEYRLVVNESGIGAAAELTLSVVPGALGAVKSNLVVPEQVRANRKFDVTIEYVNESDAEVDAPIYYLKTVGGHFVTVGDSAQIDAELLYGYNRSGNADRLPPRYRGSITRQYVSQQPVAYELFQLDRSQPFPWDAFANLEHETIPPATWRTMVAEFRTSLNLPAAATLGETVEALFGAIPTPDQTLNSGGEDPMKARTLLLAGQNIGRIIAENIPLGGPKPASPGPVSPNALADGKSLLLPGSPDWTEHADEIGRYCPAAPLRQLNSDELRELDRLSIPTRESIKNEHPELSYEVYSSSPIKYQVVWDEQQQQYVAYKNEKSQDHTFQVYLREVTDGSGAPNNPNAEAIVLVNGWKGTIPDDRIEILAKTLKHQRSQRGTRVFIFDWTEGAVDEGDYWGYYPKDPAYRMTNVSVGLNTLLDRARVDPAKTTLIGESFGAYVSSLAAAARSHETKFNQVIAFNPANRSPAWGSNANLEFTSARENKVFVTDSQGDHQFSTLTQIHNGITVHLATPYDARGDLLSRTIDQHTYGFTFATKLLMAGDSDWLDKSHTELLGRIPDHSNAVHDAHILCDKVLPGPASEAKNDNSTSSLELGSPSSIESTSASTGLARSFDPNEKIGTSGFGTEFYRQATDGLSYRINFENDPKLASAPALDVSITDVLSTNLDLDTLELGSVGFGDVVINIPAGLQSVSKTVAATNLDGTPLMVRLAVSLDRATRELRWQFTSIDPLTGQSPDSIYAGFLPVNDASHRGEGFVTFRVRPLSNLASGVKIENRAAIVFDDNAAIVTNTTSHALDSDAPSTTMGVLPLYSTDYDFTVSWQGNDAHSGVSSYDVFVSQDGGEFELWRRATSQSSATFSGQEGSRYQFYAVATDNVGLKQSSPTHSTVTHVTKLPWHNSLRPLDVNRSNSVTPIDALLIINLLNERFASSLTTPTSVPEFLPDVFGDNFLTPLDALLVINALNEGVASGEGETIGDEQIEFTQGKAELNGEMNAAHDVYFDEVWKRSRNGMRHALRHIESNSSRPW